MRGENLISRLERWSIYSRVEVHRDDLHRAASLPARNKATRARARENPVVLLGDDAYAPDVILIDR